MGKLGVTCRDGPLAGGRPADGRPGKAIAPGTTHSGEPAVGDSEAWGRQLGRIWAHQLRQQHLRPGSTVIEIGPGFSAKVGFGLAEMGFHGELILVEPNEPARRWAEREYRRLLPRATVRAHRRPVPDAALLTGPVDILAGNHLLDDLLLNACIQAAEGDQIFGAMRPGAGCQQRFVEIWRRLMLAPGLTNGMTDRVADELACYVAAVRPACLLLNEYPSWQHNRSGLAPIHEISLQIMQQVQRRLERVRPVSAHWQRANGGVMRWLISVTPDRAHRKAGP